ncbi:MAG TPA: ABC transporter permease [Gemmatimonadaceae bacterium]|nr:ABC transporter permease [Gemmatimonadaceae bacterium]
MTSPPLITLTYGQGSGSAARVLRTYVTEARYECIKMLRMPGFALPTILFPLLFYVLFGLLFGASSAGQTTMATYLLATYGVFGVVGTALFGFGVGVAAERGQGWMMVKRASPMPPLAYFTAKMAMSLLFSIVLVSLLFALGFMFGGVRFSGAQWLALGAVLILGALPFCAMGLALGYLAGPNSAPAVVNLIYLPMAFLSGLWIPVEFLPNVVQAMAPWLPPFHLAQLALSMVGAASGSAPSHVIALAAFTMLFLGLALLAMRRDEGKTYG